MNVEDKNDNNGDEAFNPWLRIVPTRIDPVVVALIDGTHKAVPVEVISDKDGMITVRYEE